LNWKFKQKVQKITEYNSNKDSDVESLTKNKKCFNILFSTKGNSYDWYIDFETSTYHKLSKSLYYFYSLSQELWSHEQRDDYNNRMWWHNYLCKDQKSAAKRCCFYF